MRRGLVTDFIMLRFGPFQTGIFNVADVIVMMGVGLLVFTFWKQRRAVAGKTATPVRRSAL